MNASLLMQLVMISVAAIIGFLYIEPTISEIKDTQDSTYAYQLEIKKVAEVTNSLKEHLVTIDSVPNNNVRALETYLPDYVEQIVVTKDIKKMVESIGGILTAISYLKTEAPVETVSEEIIDEETGEYIASETPIGEVAPPVTHVFQVGVTVTYMQLKQLISVFETNNYPLQISSLVATPSEGGFVDVIFTLETYSRLNKDSSFEDVVAAE